MIRLPPIHCLTLDCSREVAGGPLATPIPHHQPTRLDEDKWELTTPRRIHRCPRCNEAVPHRRAHWTEETRSWWCG